jgi:hypothetical protein
MTGDITKLFRTLETDEDMSELFGTEESRANSPLAQGYKSLKGAKLPSGSDIAGTEKSRENSPLGKFISKNPKAFDNLLGEVDDYNKRLSIARRRPIDIMLDREDSAKATMEGTAGQEPRTNLSSFELAEKLRKSSSVDKLMKEKAALIRHSLNSKDRDSVDKAMMVIGE